MFSRGFERLKNQEVESACMLPNQASYQLRYTPMVTSLSHAKRNHFKVVCIITQTFADVNIVKNKTSQSKLISFKHLYIYER